MSGTRLHQCEYVVFRLPGETDPGKRLGGWSACAATPRGVCKVVLPRRTNSEALAALGAENGWRLHWTPLLLRASRQLGELLRGERREVSLPVDLSGLSDFAVEVLVGVRRIGFGQTCSYQELAALVGRPSAARAVGRVMAANPVPLLIPCHRVIGSNGGLGGFGGGIGQKRALLDLESVAACG